MSFGVDVQYFTADPHFFHEKIIEYCNRPFDNAEEMNETIVKNYNYYVKPEDTVFFLGDIGFSKQQLLKDLIARLNGSKILILGNHDNSGRNTYLNMGFAAVLDSAIITIGKHKVSMSHHPIRHPLEFIRLFWLYSKKMWTSGKSPVTIYRRIKREWDNHESFKSDYHLCGHVHTAWKHKGKNLNVGVDKWNFRLVSIKQISDYIENVMEKK